jgi:hypothetical protein
MNNGRINDRAGRDVDHFRWRRDSLSESKPRKCRKVESMEAMKLLPPFPLSLEIPSGFPHSRRFDGDYVF